MRAAVLRYRDLDNDHITLKLEGDLDILHTENEVARSSHCKGTA